MRNVWLALVILAGAVRIAAGDDVLPPLVRDAIAELNKACKLDDAACAIGPGQVVALQGAKEIMRVHRELGVELTEDDAKRIEREYLAFTRDRNGTAIPPVYVNASLANRSYRALAMPQLVGSDLAPREAALLMASVVYHEFQHLARNSEPVCLERQNLFLEFHRLRGAFLSRAALRFMEGIRAQLREELRKRARASPVAVLRVRQPAKGGPPAPTELCSIGALFMSEH